MIVRLHNLFAVVMLGGIYSLLAASIFVVFDAVDVAFTEAAVGAGISTVLLLGALALTTRGACARAKFYCTAYNCIYCWFDFDLCDFRRALLRRCADTNTARRTVLLKQGIIDTGIPNVVTQVLASYRGFDTLGEVFVVFTAGVGVLMLLDRSIVTRRRRRDGGGSE